MSCQPTDTDLGEATSRTSDLAWFALLGLGAASLKTWLAFFLGLSTLYQCPSCPFFKKWYSSVTVSINTTEIRILPSSELLWILAVILAPSRENECFRGVCLADPHDRKGHHVRWAPSLDKSQVPTHPDFFCAGSSAVDSWASWEFVNFHDGGRRIRFRRQSQRYGAWDYRRQLTEPHPRQKNIQQSTNILWQVLAIVKLEKIIIITMYIYIYGLLCHDESTNRRDGLLLLAMVVQPMQRIRDYSNSTYTCLMSPLTTSLLGLCRFAPTACSSFAEVPIGTFYFALKLGTAPENTDLFWVSL